MQRRLLIVTLALTSLLCGCSNSQSISNVKTFEKDNNTLRKDEFIQLQNMKQLPSEETTNNNVNIPEYNYDSEELGVITLLNSDNSTDFKIEGDNIIYNGITYEGLYKALNYIELPDGISNATFINFILKIVKPQGTDIIVSYDSDKVVHSEDDTNVSLSDLLDGIYKYDALVKEYGEHVTWEIQLFDTQYRSLLHMYGCNKYMFMMHASDMTYDMALYNHSGENNEITLNTDEVSENEIEETEGNNEGTTENSNESTEENIENTEENTNEEAESSTNN